MSEYHYRSYTWKKGRPIPSGKVIKIVGKTYRVLSDSYQKKIVIEKYIDGKFSHTVYDSSILDFRKLKELEGKEIWYKESLDKSRSIVRDECDRVVIVERYHYANERLVMTELYSPHQLLVARQSFFYHDNGKISMEILDLEGKCVFKEKLRAVNTV